MSQMLWCLALIGLLLFQSQAQEPAPVEPAQTAPGADTRPSGQENNRSRAPKPAATESIDHEKPARVRLNSHEEEEPDPDWAKRDPFARLDFQIAKREAPSATPPPPCSICKDRGWLPNSHAAKPFILFESDPVPEPDAALGWAPCQTCTRGKMNRDFAEAERLRLAGRIAAYANHEKELGMPFIDFETRNLTGHFQTTPAEARECAVLFEKVSKTLRERGCDAFLLASPEKQHLVVCENEARYLEYLAYFTRHSGKKEEENLPALARQASSFGSRNLTVIRRDRVVAPVGSGLGHIAVFSFGQMLAREALGKETPAWFVEGFSSFCETLVYEVPLCYSIKYEPNPLSFDLSWSKAVAEGLKQNRVREWSTLFNLDMIGMSVLDYQQCWSVVRFLYHIEGDGFNRLPPLFKGTEAKKAIEIAFGQPIEKLEAAWRVWAASGR